MEDDAAIDRLITTARQYVETITGRAIGSQIWNVYYQHFPSCDYILLPFGQLQSIVIFEWTDSGGTTRSWTVNTGNLVEGSTVRAHIDTVSEPARIKLAYSQLWPTDTLKTSNPIRISINCGYTTCPPQLKAAMLLLIDHWYRNSSAVIVGEMASVSAAEIPLAFHSLVENFRLHA